MKPGERAAQARRQLDSRFKDSNADFIRARPRSGWVKAIRNALGMSQTDLARRLGVSGAAVAKLERAEPSGGITLAKLGEVAAALDCSLVYALVPNTSLEETVQHEALRIASDRLGYVTGTMALEDQNVPADRRAEYLNIYAQDLVSRNDLWGESPRAKRP
jgi:predicted DNA-binding mobile mystery protein A